MRVLFPFWAVLPVQCKTCCRKEWGPDENVCEVYGETLLVTCVNVRMMLTFLKLQPFPRNWGSQVVLPACLVPSLADDEEDQVWSLLAGQVWMAWGQATLCAMRCTVQCPSGGFVSLESIQMGFLWCFCLSPLQGAVSMKWKSFPWRGLKPKKV